MDHPGNAPALSATMTTSESDSSSDLLNGIHYYAMVLLLTERNSQPFQLTSVTLVGVPAEFKVVPETDQPSARVVLGVRADCSVARTLPPATLVSVKVRLANKTVTSQMVPLPDWREAVAIIRRSACSSP